jgi:uncharacterized Zn-binding protein involved in type VI secretion
MGDNVGNHSSGFWAGLGMIAGVVAGAIIGAALIAVTGGAILVAAAVVGAVAISAGLGAAGERLGEAFDKDEATGTPCSPILKGCFTCLIETKPAARIFDISTLCLITKTPATIKDGSKTVYIGGEPASRHKDSATCTGTIIPLTKNTYIGGPTISSSEPYQHTLAGFFHDMGSALETEAKWAGMISLGLAVIGAVPIALAAAATGGAMAGVVAGGLSLAGIGLGFGGGKVGTWAGQKGGAALDSAMGYSDHRFESFFGTVGGIGGSVGAGMAGGKATELTMGKLFPVAGKGGGGAGDEDAAGGGGKSGDDDGGGKPGGEDEAPPAGGKNEEPPTDPDDQPPDTVKLPKSEDDTCSTCGKTGDEDSPPPEDTPPKPNEPNDIVKAAIKDLPQATQDAIAKSPKLQAQIEALATDPVKPWKFVDRSNDPNYRGADCDRGNNVINLGKGYDSPQTVAHEVGHAAYKPPADVPPETNGVRLSRDEYVSQNRDHSITDEGEAIFNEHATNDEIVSNGGKPILREDGIGYDGKTTASDAYAKYKADPDAPGARDEAVKTMGDTVRNLKPSTNDPNGPKPTYDEYYAKPFEDHFDAHIQPARDAADAAAYKANKDAQTAAANDANAVKQAVQDGSLSKTQGIDQLQAAENRLTDLKVEAWNNAAKQLRTSSENARSAIEILRAEQAARNARYDAFRDSLGEAAGAPTVPRPPAPKEDCPTCGGTDGPPNASDLVAPAPGKDTAFEDMQGMTKDDFDGVNDPKLKTITDAATITNAEVAARVRKALADAGIEGVTVQNRAKSIKSLLGKLQETDGQTVGGIKDLSGVRINIQDVNQDGFAQHSQIADAIKNEFDIPASDVKDYNAKPNSWGYTGRVHLFTEDATGVHSEIQVGSQELSDFIETKVQMPDGSTREIHDLTGYKGQLYGAQVPEGLQSQYSSLIGRIGQNNGTGQNIGDNAQLSSDVSQFQNDVQAWANGLPGK